MMMMADRCAIYSASRPDSPSAAVRFSLRDCHYVLYRSYVTGRAPGGFRGAKVMAQPFTAPSLPSSHFWTVSWSGSLEGTSPSGCHNESLPWRRETILSRRSNDIIYEGSLICSNGSAFNIVYYNPDPWGISFNYFVYSITFQAYSDVNVILISWRRDT